MYIKHWLMPPNTLRVNKKAPPMRGKGAPLPAGTRAAGSPPLTRGKGDDGVDGCEKRRITPAYAGSG